MAGLGIKVFADEDVDAGLARLLREHGYDAESCLEAGRSNRRIPDPEQLTYATEQGRAILVFNVRDYVLLDVTWKASGQEHAGIIASPKIADVGELLRRVMRYLDTTEPETQWNTLLWLGKRLVQGTQLTSGRNSPTTQNRGTSWSGHQSRLGPPPRQFLRGITRYVQMSVYRVC